MKTDTFDYQLPSELIAQHPLPRRDDSRLLVLHRDSGHIEHRHFKELGEYLRSGDILLANDSKVFPARLYGRKTSGGKVEILLLERLGDHDWKAIVGGKRLDAGKEIVIEDRNGSLSGPKATVVEVLDGAQRIVRFEQPVDDELESLGHTPLPPYIHEILHDADRYQTIYARPLGSAAAPTAGLHFTGDLLFDLRGRGVLFDTCTLHVGLDTFKPVEEENIYEQRDAAGETSNLCPWKPVAAFEGPTDLFLAPGYRFRAVDMMLTNFHLPKSSLLMLVSAFAGRELILGAYEAAVREQYRFYSFGDAMLII